MRERVMGSTLFFGDGPYIFDGEQGKIDLRSSYQPTKGDGTMDTLTVTLGTIATLAITSTVVSLVVAPFML